MPVKIQEISNIDIKGLQRLIGIIQETLSLGTHQAEFHKIGTLLISNLQITPTLSVSVQLDRLSSIINVNSNKYFLYSS